MGKTKLLARFIRTFRQQASKALLLAGMLLVHSGLVHQGLGDAVASTFQITLVSSTDQLSAYTVDLNTKTKVPSGISTLSNWVVTGAAGPASISSAGILTIPARYGLLQQDVPVAATDLSGKRWSGVVSVNLFVSSFANSFNALVSDSGAAVNSGLDLGASQTALPGTVASRVWAFTSGQEVPSWLTLSAGGTLSGAPPVGTPTVSRDYVVEVADTSASPVTKVYGKLSVNLLGFSTSLLGDANQNGGSSLELSSLVPASAGLTSAAVWSFANPVGTPLPGYVVISPTGTLNVPQYSQVRGEVLVKAIEGTKTVLGRVVVNAVWLGAGSTVSVEAGKVGGTSLSVTSLPNLSLSGTTSTRSWAWTPGQTIPAWVNLAGDTGLLTLSPGTSDSVATLYLDQKVNDGVSASITTTKVTLGPRNFTAAFFADASLYSGSTSALTLPLNTTVAGVIAGFSGTNTWSLLGGQQDWVTQGVTVSSAGTLSVTQDALNYMSGKNVFVQVVGASGARAVGSVLLRADYPTVVPFYSVVGNGTPKALDLGALPFMQYPGWSRSWTLTAGVGSAPAAVALNANGTLNFAAVGTLAATGVTPIYVDFVGVPPGGGALYTQTLKVQWDVVNFSAPVVWDVSKLVGLNLNASLPASAGLQAPLSWALVAGQNPDTVSGWSLSSGGTLVQQYGP
ncbi:MAG: hypothetical protein WCK17_05285, partial [Verrucomicrobiota bacterium]